MREFMGEHGRRVGRRQGVVHASNMIACASGAQRPNAGMIQKMAASPATKTDARMNQVTRAAYARWFAETAFMRIDVDRDRPLVLVSRGIWANCERARSTSDAAAARTQQN